MKYIGRHRKNEDDNPTERIPLTGSLVSEYVNPSKCQHPHTITLTGRVLCNSGCGADLGPANG